jgi:ABC-type phosphate/phosphonate transport system substrate-binding protein
VLVRADSGIERIADLAGRAVAVGAADSPQATLIPLLHLAEHGLEPQHDIRVVYHDRLLGKHGDHIGGERDAVRALVAGSVDAACLIDGNQLLFAREGTIPADAVRILTQTAPYDHCNFTVFDDAPAALVARFRDLWLQMRYADAEVRPLLDLEGLKRWEEGRVDGYALLERAVDRFRYLEPWLTTMTAS